MVNPNNNPCPPAAVAEKFEPMIMQRRCAAHRRETVARLLPGKSLGAVSREIGIEPYRPERWR